MSSSARGLLATGLLLGCLTHAHAADRQLFEAVEPHMGTLVRIKLYADGAGQAKAAFRAAFDRIAQLDDALSDYKPASELNRICRTAVARPVEAGADLFRVLEASQKLAGETDGAFDVTLGPVIRLWRQARNTNRLPDSAALREAAGRCGYRKLHLDPAKQTVMLDQAGMQLDAGGIAKGYAADAALSILAQLGIRSALVAASGDLAFGDPPPGQRGWKIGVDSFDRPEAAFTRVLELSNAAVSTSGDHEQHLDIDGARYSHIIDPSTAMGLSQPITVTIIARHGIDADGLATAVSVLGPERGIALIEKQAGVAGLVMTGHVVESSRWPGRASGYARTSCPVTPDLRARAPRGKPH
jgi:FAD:protein FMN transferase